MRINKYLAQCGLGSRRSVEALIAEGKVLLNGQVVTDLATQIDEAQDQVEVGGKTVQPPRRHVYYILNKPKGYDVTRGGRHHHRRAWDLLPKGTHASVQSVGRLDRDSTGLLLFTNDGELAFRLSHPSHGCTKVYEVLVEGEISDETVRQLIEGVTLEDGPARALSARKLEAPEKDQGVLALTMGEGRKRIVRRMCEAVGHPVIDLHRTDIGPLNIGNLRKGMTRPLTKAEVRNLYKAAGLEYE